MFADHTTALFPNIFFFILQHFFHYIPANVLLDTMASGDHEEISHAELSSFYQTVYWEMKVPILADFSQEDSI